ncbi:MAG: undecaprenyl/decaprenyl-phosphate alpha-N-acetylglucosaminyl 1-phosphate transferase [Verrucomicrobia bacterium]|nr:undecaprenyl/decaprenyl-phosphate alpha-N-acetylglucosaminyl 1-phosphate transferase [Verrucomicrobiota bacterium]
MSVSHLLGGLVFAAAAATSALSLPVWRRLCWKLGLVDAPGERKLHPETVALAGGWAVLTGLLVPMGCLAALDAWTGPGSGLRGLWVPQPPAQPIPLAALLAGALGMTLLGAADDRWELRPPVKLAGQLLVALLVALAGLRFAPLAPGTGWSCGVTVLWILIVTNAFNFMDNMNGLCAGLGAIAALGLGLAAPSTQPMASALAFAAAGALAGFLPYNFPRAAVFLGDAGSHLAGYLAAVLAIVTQWDPASRPRGFGLLSPVLILAVPLFDLVWVVILRWRLRQPVYRGDTRHLSHRLVRRGWTPVQAVTGIWLLAALLAALALLMNRP